MASVIMLVISMPLMTGIWKDYSLRCIVLKNGRTQAGPPWSSMPFWLLPLQSSVKSKVCLPGGSNIWRILQAQELLQVR